MSPVRFLLKDKKQFGCPRENKRCRAAHIVCATAITISHGILSVLPVGGLSLSGGQSMLAESLMTRVYHICCVSAPPPPQFYSPVKLILKNFQGTLAFVAAAVATEPWCVKRLRAPTPLARC
jgi:hypothetical protein